MPSKTLLAGLVVGSAALAMLFRKDKPRGGDGGAEEGGKEAEAAASGGGAAAAASPAPSAAAAAAPAAPVAVASSVEEEVIDSGVSSDAVVQVLRSLAEQVAIPAGDVSAVERVRSQLPKLRATACEAMGITEDQLQAAVRQHLGVPEVGSMLTKQPLLREAVRFVPRPRMSMERVEFILRQTHEEMYKALQTAVRLGQAEGLTFNVLETKYYHNLMADGVEALLRREKVKMKEWDESYMAYMMHPKIVAVAQELLQQHNRRSTQLRDSYKVDVSKRTPVSDAPLTKEALHDLLQHLILEIDLLVKKLPEMGLQLREEMAAAADKPSREDLAGILMQRFQEQLMQKHEDVYAAHSTTESAVTAARSLYATEPMIVEQLKRLQSMMSVMNPSELESDMPVEKLVAIMGDIFASMAAAMEKAAAMGKEEGLSFDAAMARHYQALNKASKTAVHKKHDVAADEVQAAYMKHQSSPELSAAMERLVAQHGLAEQRVRSSY